MVVSPIMSYCRHIGFQDGRHWPTFKHIFANNFCSTTDRNKIQVTTPSFWVWPIKWCHWRLCHMAAILDFKMATIVDTPYTWSPIVSWQGLRSLHLRITLPWDCKVGVIESPWLGEMYKPTRTPASRFSHVLQYLRYDGRWKTAP